MPRVDFLISNDGHHAAMLQPVVHALATRPDYHCRIISLCEFRGIRSPAERFQMQRVALARLLPFRFRSSSAGRQTSRAESRRTREFVRWLSWRLLLNQPLQACLATKPDLVVLPNDAAFPYDRIARVLHARSIPFVLVQEGIRFPLPAADSQEIYGRGGAAAIAAWGETSAAYFRQQGVPEDKIHLTGNPRFDAISTTDWQAEANRLAARWNWGPKNLLLLSNPIDDQGFCTTQEKLDLIRRFVTEIAPLFDDPGFHLIVKLHGRESVRDFEALVNGLPVANRVTVLSAAPLYPLFMLSQAAIVLASTVGLEALFFGLPLGVLEIPGTGFVYDYVSGGAAHGLTWNASMADQVRGLLQSRPQARPSAAAYVARNLATREGATGRVVKLITRLAENGLDQIK